MSSNESSAPDRGAFSLEEVEVRLARPDERVKWDALVRENHYLEFKRFAGRGLRYVVAWRGRWLALAGWQTGAFKCRPRDRWIGWKPANQFRRLHLIANNTRFVLLTKQRRNLASFAMAQMLNRLSDDWQAHWGHRLLLAETFVDPSRFEGTIYKAGNWTYVGDSKGYSRSNGQYTEPQGTPKQLYVCPLRRDAQRLLRAKKLPAEWERTGAASGRKPGELRALCDEFAEIVDFRRAQGRKHSAASVFSVYILAWLAGFRGPVAAADYAKSLTQEELKALGAWKNKKTELYEAVSKSTIHRVVSNIDPIELEKALVRYAAPRLEIGRAIAADGKRIRHRTGSVHTEIATLVEHNTGIPLASIGFHDEGGEIAAVRALLESVDVSGRVVTLDALHTTRDTARIIVETHCADYLLSIKGNSPETCEHLETIEWERDADASCSEEADLAHGRIDQRHIHVVRPLPGAYPHVKQIFRVTREREIVKTGAKTTEYAYGITSLAEADAGELLAFSRGHWSVENKNHRARDVNFREDDSQFSTGFGPANNATIGNIACAVIFHKAFDGVAQTTRTISLDRQKGMEAILLP